MRLPRFRIRTLMIAVAVVATALSAGFEAIRLRRISVARWQKAQKLRGYETIGLRSVASTTALVDEFHEGARQARNRQVPEIWAVSWRERFRSRIRIAERNGEDTRERFEELAMEVDKHARGFEKVLARTAGRLNEIEKLRREYERASWLPWLPDPPEPK